MLIGRDGISNDIITLGTCFSKFVYIRALPLRADWWKSDSWVDGEPRELEEEFKFQRRSCKLSFLFPPCRQSSLESFLAGYSMKFELLPQILFLWILVKSYFPVLIFPWNYLPCVCNLEYNFNTVLHCTHAKLQGIWYGYICLWQHSFHGNGENSFLK